MTDALATALHAMVPAFEGESGDWERVCQDAQRRARPSARRRRLVLGAALALALLLVVPLAVVGSSRDWWFFAQGEHPKPATPVAVLESGTWSGRRWTLISAWASPAWRGPGEGRPRSRSGSCASAWRERTAIA